MVDISEVFVALTHRKCAMRWRSPRADAMVRCVISARSAIPRPAPAHAPNLNLASCAPVSVRMASPGTLEHRTARSRVDRSLGLQTEERAQWTRNRPGRVRSHARIMAQIRRLRSEFNAPLVMSGTEGRADIVCQGLSGPFIAINGLSGHVPMSLPDLFCGTEISVGNVQVGPAIATRFAQLDLALKR